MPPAVDTASSSESARPEEAVGLATNAPEAGGGAAIAEILVADEPAAWTAAGFTVVDDVVRLGPTSIRLTGQPPVPAEGNPRRGRGIRAWTLAGLTRPDGDAPDAPIDGLPTTVVSTAGLPAAAEAGQAEPDSANPAHPNGSHLLDHVVVTTPGLDRTTAAFAPLGLGVRRIRETDTYGAPMYQAFLRLGPTLVEVVSGDRTTDLTAADARARWFGLAIQVDDLDTTSALLGEHLGQIKAAVQDGQRIATLRHEALGMSVAVAFMDERG